MFKCKDYKFMLKYHLLAGGKTKTFCGCPALKMYEISFVTKEDITPKKICRQCLTLYGNYILKRETELGIVNDNDEREKTDTI